ncbi:diaminopimelate decarboxylase [Microlunatus phosphovorus NM-1]|uniref:Diaminopimelate decarboxylase n=1 Tax=Microlunatus phosphovorus (strain ATCC 700054 / DSM 10555 / JCM 9379 / NBRC 101784 / NCIMB 13414 / VKM Ac-1990 / NM-1) TaxID=1032480 RepID=F5XKI0_MICPN|nr:diaminopimelate decarboxylase [Microlunatus phosphovorus]BAK36052.1 diaminopimelate decarboxylase [Microlunatus phosphovorus NM-1]
MTHMHVAGSIHADVLTHAPGWLDVPADVNALLAPLWSRNVAKNADGVLTVAGLTVTEIAEQVGTPVYVVDEDDLRHRAREFAAAFAGWDVYYAGKSFLCTAVARWVADEGLGVDTCSGGELAVALRAGVDPARIGLHGNNKSDTEIELALDAGVGRIIADSFDEIARLIRLVRTRDRGERPRLMVRVTTGVEAHTHAYIATAHEDQKFGFSIASGNALDALLQVHAASELELIGIHSHIGSQIFDAEGFAVAARRTLGLHAEFAARTGVEPPEMDLGGGFGIAYTSADTPATPAELAEAMRRIVEVECAAHGVAVPHLSIEPGRAISGPSAFALYEVGTVKRVELDGGAVRTYVAVDGGMSDNIRTALYAAEYSATLASRRSAAGPAISRVVGKHCEGGDILVRDEFLPADVTPGDLVAVPASGAYSRSMASNYNHVPRPPVIAVADGRIQTLLRRETLDDILRLDVG